MSYTKHILLKKKNKKTIVPTLKRVHILYELPATMNYFLIKLAVMNYGTYSQPGKVLHEQR